MAGTRGGSGLGNESFTMSFTGPREGMTRHQVRSFTHLAGRYQPDGFRHGDCIGADATAHDIIRFIAPWCFIMAHYPDSDVHRAWCITDAIEPPKPHLERNLDIAQQGDLLVATPAQYAMITRSGTWATVRYALAAGTPVTVIWPCGCVQENYQEGMSHEHEDTEPCRGS